MVMCSPHARGWTAPLASALGHAWVFPARAGMDRVQWGVLDAVECVPRTRGDGPQSGSPQYCGRMCSPHARGWTGIPVPLVSRAIVFPARAGMDRYGVNKNPKSYRVPRTRGDGPSAPDVTVTMTPCSPHARGWTDHIHKIESRLAVFPARAGMDRRGPELGAMACGVPRTRGDGPALNALSSWAGVCSPHARGWTVYSWPIQRPGYVFPARAGMDRPRGSPPRPSPSVPRTRGDGPVTSSGEDPCHTCSPHARGWTACGVRTRRHTGVFPARAGMDRPLLVRRRLCGGVPRTRGDGPGAMEEERQFRQCSPHARGWTALGLE